MPRNVEVAGIGGGVRIGPAVAIELSFTRAFLDEDLDQIALGVRF